ncbi:MAG: tRNA 2-thiouridine(34) synthase MnmA [Deltaproteobacteria bacterium HGW-Deltaproteobacteria-12]|jgi:tRNA-specific 2-thiouridylase|nr:MAG: tRNA 2-thiouridine(34) synthase MnmA [Deltaproteobacteria bacterium HGW-Deltaproteobacteria-12]
MDITRTAGKKKVLAAMSGGVDSSAAACLLKEAGYDVTGVTMCLGIREDGDRTRCCGLDAIDDAKRVCDQLQIPHFVFDFAGEMEERVIGKFTSEYRRGRTPNPCIDCNRFLKFGSLLGKARGMGFDYLATGHYARIEKQGEDWRLLRPKDRIKDQTYFLYPIAAADLASILFPLGGLNKEEVRALTKKAGLHVAQKAESQDICFVTQGSYGQFFQERNVPFVAGDIVDKTGQILGRHKGIIYYTIGQRGGLGISARTPLYVVEIDAVKNKIVVGEKNDLYSAGLIAGDINLLTAELPDKVEAKIRYRKKPARCTVAREGGRLRVLFEEKQESITPGQAVVLYCGDEVLGGGVIEEVTRDVNP